MSGLFGLSKVVVHVHGLRNETLIHGHKLGDERFQMKDMLISELHTMFVDASEFNGFCLNRHVTIADQLFDQTLEDHVGWNTLRQHFVQALPNTFQSAGCLFEKYLRCSVAQIDLPIQFDDILVRRERILLYFARFQHE